MNRRADSYVESSSGMVSLFGSGTDSEGTRYVSSPAMPSRSRLVTKTTTYIYRQGKESVTIVFVDDKVHGKQSTLSE